MGSKSKAEKPDHRGSYLLYPRQTLESQAYRTASPRCLKALTAVFMRHNGFNNGRIGLCARDLAELMGTQNHTANLKAIGEAVARGFLVVEKDRPKGQRLAREYRITFIPTQTMSATHDYLQWSEGDAGTRNKPTPPAKKRIAVSTTEKPVSVVVSKTGGKQTVVVSTKAENENGENPPISEPASVVVSTAHIVSQYRGVGGSDGRSIGNLVKHTPKHGGSLSAAPPPQELRGRVLDVLGRLGRGWQNRLANEATIPVGTLSKFLHREGPLDDAARIRLTCALPKIERAFLHGNKPERRFGWWSVDQIINADLTALQVIATCQLRAAA